MSGWGRGQSQSIVAISSLTRRLKISRRVDLNLQILQFNFPFFFLPFFGIIHPACHTRTCYCSFFILLDPAPRLFFSRQTISIQLISHDAPSRQPPFSFSYSLIYSVIVWFFCFVLFRDFVNKKKKKIIIRQRFIIDCYT